MDRLANRRPMRTKIFHQRERYYLKYEASIWEKFTFSIEKARDIFGRVKKNAKKCRNILNSTKIYGTISHGDLL